MPKSNQSKSTSFLRFSLLSVSIAILFLCAVLAFWISPSLKQKKLAQWIVENGGYISYSAEDHAAEFYSRAEYGLLGYWPGVDFIDHLSTIHLTAPVSDISALSQANAVFQITITEFTGTDLSPICNLYRLEQLRILKSKAIHLNDLIQLSNLTNLTINNCQLADIQGITNCSNLSSLDLRNTQVADIQILQHLIELNNLDLSNTNVIDFRPLEKLENLSRLNLRGTDISPSSLHALRTALPNCTIDADERSLNF
jgi:hypothetical protein